MGPKPDDAQSKARMRSAISPSPSLDPCRRGRLPRGERALGCGPLLRLSDQGSASRRALGCRFAWISDRFRDLVDIDRGTLYNLFITDRATRLFFGDFERVPFRVPHSSTR